MRKGWLLFVVGWLLILGGSWLASAIQTSGGIKVEDVRFKGTGGVTMSGLLYTPPNATAARPAPGILAVHGYINSRETQSAFAIEYARRGYVVLALDQTGHGYSGGAAFSNGFGGPDGLKYLRSLPNVDTDLIGLEGHSMGGWTVLAAAAAMPPESYSSVVLVGSSTGAPFAADGTPAWPMNLAVIFSRYDEFSGLMWGVKKAGDVGDSAKLKALFGTKDRVEAGRDYGHVMNLNARRLYQPSVTHPGDHLSTAAVADSLDWFDHTLGSLTTRPVGDQIWMWKEAGTGLALVGFIVLLLGTFAVLLDLPLFATLRGTPTPSPGGKVRLALTALIPVLTYFPAFIAVTLLIKPSAALPQTVTTQVVLWALINLVITLGMGLIGKRPKAGPRRNILVPAVLIALAVTAVGYLSLVLVDRLFTVDFRFWVVALKLFSPHQAMIALIYLLPLTAFFWVSLNALHRRLTGSYLTAILAMTGGFLLFLIVDYGLLFATGRLPTDFDPLSTVIAIQFVRSWRPPPSSRPSLGGARPAPCRAP